MLGVERLTDATVILTKVLLWALRVGGAFRWRENALARNPRVTSKVGNTGADTVVVQGLAECILTTSTKKCTRIRALLGNARLLKATVGIISTAV